MRKKPVKIITDEKYLKEIEKKFLKKFLKENGFLIELSNGDLCYFDDTCDNCSSQRECIKFYKEYKNKLRTKKMKRIIN